MTVDETLIKDVAMLRRQVAELLRERERYRQNNRDLAAWIRRWYTSGRKGLTTLAAKREMTPELIEHIEYWFKKGDVNFFPIIKALEEEETK